MVNNDLPVVHAMVQNLQESHSTQRLRIMDTYGYVRISSTPSEVGIRLTKNDRLCQPCHLNGAAPRTGTTVIHDPGGRDTLLTVTAIRNQPACGGCHDTHASMLGIMLTENSLTDLYHQLSITGWSLIIAATLVFLFLVLTLAHVFRRLVTRPLHRLMDGLAAVGTGDLEHGVSISGEDELGQLAGVFDDMRQKLQASRADVERRNDDLALLNRVGLAASQAEELQEVMDQSLSTVNNGLGLQVGLIFLLNPATGQYERCANYHMPNQLLPELEHRRRMQNTDRIAEIVATGQMYFVPDISTDPLFDGLWPDPHGRSLVNLPLRARGKITGTLSLLSRAGRPLTPHDIEVLNNITYEIGMTVEKAQLREQMRYMGALEKRDRLARELHDSLAQALGYLKIRAGLAERQVADGRIAEAQANLADLKDKVQAAYVDVREAIFNLRTALATEVRLVPNLREYLAEYGSHYGVEARLDSDGTDGLQITPEARLQVLRIVQEALSNVRKHARAAHATVHLHLEERQIVIRIEDDGQGFDTGCVRTEGRQRFGLQVMRERAASIGGTLWVHSQPGEGTQIELRLPRTA
jgi:nitrate/nitrite-specific signal transduction histidine kinase